MCTANITAAKPEALVLVDQFAIESEGEIRPLFSHYEQAGALRRKSADALGHALAKWRDLSKSQGSHGGKGFKHLLEYLGIPRATAYRLIDRVSPETKSQPAPNTLTIEKLAERLLRTHPRLFACIREGKTLSQRTAQFADLVAASAVPVMTKEEREDVLAVLRRAVRQINSLIYKIIEG